MGDYYERATQTYLDGSPIFKTEFDERNEGTVARIVESHWRCKLFSYGRLAPIDWWAQEDDRVIGYLELKSRTHDSRKFDTVWLNQRKFLWLWNAQNAFAAPAIFVVKFTDCVRWITVGEIMNAGIRVKVAGLRKYTKSRNDIEPVIEILVSDMSLLAYMPGGPVGQKA